MSMRQRHWRRWLLIGGLAVVALVAGAAAFLYWPRPPTPITEEEALRDFRDRTDGSVATAGPPPGVYSYDAEGTEDISIGPIPLPTRDIPEVVTIIVQPATDGCYRSTLNLMSEHTETTTWCLGAGRTRAFQRQEKQEQVPGFHVTAVTDCDPATVMAPDTTTTEVRCTLHMDVSGLSLTVDLSGTATVEPGGDVEVGGTTVATRRLVLAMDATGDLSGHWREEHWLTDDLLPVRLVRDVVLRGPGDFDEQSTLTLRSLRPQT
jgi:hypothetical protein